MYYFLEKKEKVKKIIDWYLNSLGRILLLFIVIVTFTLTVVYVPYINLIFPSIVGLSIVLLFWYLLFPPSTRLLITLSFIFLFFSLLNSLVGLTALSEICGQAIYVFLIFIFVNRIREASNK